MRPGRGAAYSDGRGKLDLYVQNVANGNVDLLATTGFPLRRHGTRSVVMEVPPAPTGVRTSGGMVSGSVLIRSVPVPRAASYDVQVTAADPTVESNWTAAGSYKNCGRIELSGLATLKTWSVRLRALGSAGPGAWSVPVSLLVV